MLVLVKFHTARRALWETWAALNRPPYLTGGQGGPVAPACFVHLID